MDAYYQNQVNTPYFAGAARQRGSGLGSMALSVARTALPIFRNYVVPTLKSLGISLFVEAVPEVGQVLSGNQSLETAAKNTVTKTVKRQLGGSRKRKTTKSRSLKKKKSTSKKPRKRRPKRRKIDILANLR